MTQTRVSVALCSHDGARFIEAQLRSILDQTIVPDEIVLSDDASTDATVALAERVLDRHGAGIAFRVLRNDAPLGVTANFEQAILACRGEFVALSDQDDIWEADRVEKALAVFSAKNGLDLVHSDAWLVDEDGAPLGSTLFEALGVSDSDVAAIHSGHAIRLLMRRNLVTGATLMVRRDLAVYCAPFPKAWLHDEWLAVVAATRGGVDVVAEPLICYRQHGSNQVGVTKLSVAGKFARMIQPGTERSARLLARASDLAERAPRLMPGLAADADDKLEHERMRSALPSWRPARLPRILGELRTGRYRRFGRGTSDAVRDLLQPLEGRR